MAFIFLVLRFMHLLLTGRFYGTKLYSSAGIDPDESGYARQALERSQFPGDLLVLAIRRNDEVIVPHGTTRLALGDHLTVLGNLDTIQMAEDWTSGW
jgi:Trk K+ transport system NAD-binding subunit